MYHICLSGILKYILDQALLTMNDHPFSLVILPNHQKNQKSKKPDF